MHYYLILIAENNLGFTLRFDFVFFLLDFVYFLLGLAFPKYNFQL